MSENEELEFEAELTLMDGNTDTPRTTVYEVASEVMDEYGPGFVVIGSPILQFAENGDIFPESIGVLINGELDMTPLDLSRVLRVISESIEAQMETIENAANGEHSD